MPVKITQKFLEPPSGKILNISDMMANIMNQESHTADKELKLQPKHKVFILWVFI